MNHSRITNKLPRTSQTLAVAFALALTLALVAPTWASVSSEQQAGAQIQAAVREGRLKAPSLSSSQYEGVGEYLMGQTLGSTTSHEHMNSLMAEMTGSAAVDQMHIYLGERYFGKNAQIPGRYAPVYGLIGMMTGYRNSSIAHMMHGYLSNQTQSSSGSSSGMMDFGAQGQQGSTGGWSTGATIVTTALATMLLGAVAALAVRMRRRRSGALGGLPADSPVR